MLTDFAVLDTRTNRQLWVERHSPGAIFVNPEPQISFLETTEVCVRGPMTGTETSPEP